MDDGNAINSGGVAVFIAKVWRIVEDPEYKHLISWSEVSHCWIVLRRLPSIELQYPANHEPTYDLSSEREDRACS